MKTFWWVVQQLAYHGAWLVVVLYILKKEGITVGKNNLVPTGIKWAGLVTAACLCLQILYTLWYLMPVRH